MLWSAQYAVPHLISIAAGLLMWLAAACTPRLGRALYVALFAWACSVNWSTALGKPHVYLEYADLALMPWYRDFIHGFFADHVLWLVGTIATCQGMIAAGLLVGGVLARIALLGATLFLIAIAPLGVGSGFPSTLFMAAGCVTLLRRGETLRLSLPHAVLRRA